MLKKIFEDIRKKGSFSFEKIIEHYTMSDDEFFEFLKFVHLENIPEVRNSTDGSDFIVLEDENIFIREKEELLDRYLKIAVRESLLYSKYGFSFLDTVQEATLGIMSGLSYYSQITKITKEPEFFIKNFAVKYILEYQKELLKDIKSSELSYILYLKVKVDKSMGLSMEEISRQMNVTTEYIEQLEMLFDEVEPEELMENTQIFEKADKITQMYILENIPKKLNYLDEQILVMTYGLDDKVYTEKEIAKSLNIAKHNVKILKEKALNKLSIDMMRNDFVENSEEVNYTVN